MQSQIALFLLLAGALLADTTTSYEGVVIDAATREPVRKAEVGLNGDKSYFILTGADGHFRFEDIPPGTYSVEVERQGYLDCSCLEGVRIVAGQKVTGVELRISRYGAITGHVVDPDGDPVPEGTILLSKPVWKHGQRKLNVTDDRIDVDDRGMFRVGKLAPGKYYVAVRTRSEYGTMFYPSATDAADAIPVEVQAGQEGRDIEIKLREQRTYHISGKLSAVDVPKGYKIQIAVQCLSAFFDQWTNYSSQIHPDNTFLLAGVPSGAYRLRVAFFSNSTPEGMVYATLGEAEVQVNGHDVTGLAIDLTLPRELRISAEVEGEHPDLEKIRLSLEGESFTESAAFKDGQFVYPKIAPGVYWARLRSFNGYFVKAVRIGNRESQDPMLDLRNLGDAPVTVILSRKSAEVRAALHGDRVNAAKTTATLIPDSPDPSVRERGTLSVESDQAGTYVLQNIPPGGYRLFAWKDAADEPWNNGDLWDAVKDQGVALKLDESDRKTVEIPSVVVLSPK